MGMSKVSNDTMYCSPTDNIRILAGLESICEASFDISFYNRDMEDVFDVFSLLIKL